MARKISNNKKETVSIKKTKKKKQSKITIQNIDLDSNLQETEDFEKPKHESLEYTVDTSFFYTNDKFINTLDNDEILLRIRQKYPNLNSKSEDSAIKKSIIQLLNNDKFVNHILNFYSLTIYELIKIIIKKYDNVFKKLFIKKVQNIIAEKKYK